MNFSALNEKRLYLKIADNVLSYIKQHDLAVGEKLPSERILSAEFKVSRPTVREALVALELAGIVEIRTASGIFLKNADTTPNLSALDKGAGPFEILDARRILESEACALAAKNISSEQLDHLSALLKTMEEENLQENPTEQADQAFHCRIAEASGNSAIQAMVEWLWVLRNQSDISTHFHKRVRLEGIRPIITDHTLILAALKAGDSAQARQTMNDHLQRVIDALISDQ